MSVGSLTHAAPQLSLSWKCRTVVTQRREGNLSEQRLITKASFSTKKHAMIVSSQHIRSRTLNRSTWTFTVAMAVTRAAQKSNRQGSCPTGPNPLLNLFDPQNVDHKACLSGTWRWTHPPRARLGFEAFSRSVSFRRIVHFPGLSA